MRSRLSSFLPICSCNNCKTKHKTAPTSWGRFCVSSICLLILHAYFITKIRLCNQSRVPTGMLLAPIGNPEPKRGDPSLKSPRPFRIPNKRLNTQSSSIGWIFTNRYFFCVHSCPCLLGTLQSRKHTPPYRLSRAYLHFLQYSTTSHSIMYKHPFKLYNRKKC